EERGWGERATAEAATPSPALRAPSPINGRGSSDGRFAAAFYGHTAMETELLIRRGDQFLLHCTYHLDTSVHVGRIAIQVGELEIAPVVAPFALQQSRVEQIGRASSRERR